MRVATIGARLAAVCALTDLQYHVIDDDGERNAFVSAGMFMFKLFFLPQPLFLSLSLSLSLADASSGGHVVVYSGLLHALDNDDMLAAVLGHEIGHYIARAYVFVSVCACLSLSLSLSVTRLPLLRRFLHKCCRPRGRACWF